MDLMTALSNVGACEEAKRWLAAERLRAPMATKSQERWDACQRGDWMLWLAAKANVDRKRVVMAACACARLALVHVPAGEMRPLAAIETAEAWCRGEATIEQVKAARDAAWRCPASAAAAAASAAYAAYADAAAYAAAYAASAAASAAGRSSTLARCADEVRKRIAWSEVERGLYLAAGGVL